MRAHACWIIALILTFNASGADQPTKVDDRIDQIRLAATGNPKEMVIFEILSSFFDGFLDDFMGDNEKTR